jgi:heptosyltransferase-3
MTQRDMNNILLITLSNIGDAIMTTPVMEALHRKYPQAVMDIVADARSCRLFEHCPYRGEIILKDKQSGWRGTAALVRKLRTRRYGLVVDLRTDGLALLLRAKRRLTRRGSKPPGYHAVERHFGVIGQRETLTEIPAMRVWLTDAESGFAREQLSGLPGNRWLALGPGANWAPKRWPTGHFCKLVEQLRDEFDAVILLGSQADQEICKQVADNLPLPCVNLAGNTNLLQAAAILAQVQLFVGNDSGPGHLAAASGTPTVTVFGPGDPRRYHPWHPDARWVQSTTDSIADVPVSSVVTLVEARNPHA